MIMKRLIGVFLLCCIFFAILGCARMGMVEKGDRYKIIVFAAASLKESFTEIGNQFEKMEGDRVKVEFNFAGSQTLRTSLENGIKADLFASADIKNIEKLKDEGLISHYDIFAKNKLVLIRNKESEYEVKDLKSLTSNGIKIAVGDRTVPAGKYWELALEKALKDGTIEKQDKEMIENNIKTRELNVKDVVSKVLLNQVDVGVVYLTDINESNSDKLQGVVVPVFEEIIASYPVAVLGKSESNEYAKKFYDYVLSNDVKKILEKYKFIVE